MSVPTVTLPSGDEMPIVGAGTWSLGDAVKSSVRSALDGEYTHLDTSEAYRNEAEIGEAIAEGSYDREDLFLTSKVVASNLHYDSLIESCEASLERLGADYLDLYLIHWPNPAISLRETLNAMATLHDRGLVRNVGVSNFSAYQLSNALHITDVPIAVNQIEFHPWFQQSEVVEYAQEEGVAVEAAAPLAQTDVLGDDTVTEIAESYDRTPAQVVLRWATEKGITVIPRSSSADHIAENIDLFDWELDEADHERLDDLDRNYPVYDPPAKDWTEDIYGIPE